MTCSNLVKLPTGNFFLKNAVANMLPGDVLDLSSGIYGGSQSCNITVTVSNIMIRGKDGPDRTVIDCNNQGRHFAIISSNVSIVGLHLMRGTAGRGQSSYGGCMHVMGQNVYVSNTRFSGCSAESGGAIAVTGTGNLTVNNITIAMSVASNGAGIFSDGNILIRDSNFYNNTASVSGGVIFASNFLTLQGAKRIQVRMLGNVSFTNNTAQDGGAIYVNGGSAGAWVSLEGSTSFSLNRVNILAGGQSCALCRGKGGAIFAQNFVEFYVQGNATFRANYAIQGGGVYFGRSSSVKFSGSSEFKENAAAIGGAVFIGDMCSMSAIGSISFLGNQANASTLGPICSGYICESVGGSIYGGYKSASILLAGGAKFSDNYADNGGAVYTEGIGCSFQIVGSAAFSRNTAKNGGAIGIGMDQTFRANISGFANFSSNHALQDGGAIQVAGCSGGETDCYLTISDHVTFEKNQAMRDGGAISVTGVSSTKIAGFVQFLGNKAQRGGGMFVQGIRTALTPTILNITDSVFLKGNIAFSGGAVSSFVNVLIFISGQTLISYNSATSSGGGANIESFCRVHLQERASFVGNTAGGNGGAIFLNDQSYVSVSDNCLVHGNTGLNGGGISVEQNSNMTGSWHANFSGNKALLNGGAILGGAGCSVVLNGVFLEKNSAAKEGGGICITFSSALVINSATSIRNNQAQTGGAISARSALFIFVIAAQVTDDLIWQG
jgi:predicted outer membrane repeat protein